MASIKNQMRALAFYSWTSLTLCLALSVLHAFDHDYRNNYYIAFLSIGIMGLAVHRILAAILQQMAGSKG